MRNEELCKALKTTMHSNGVSALAKTLNSGTTWCYSQLYPRPQAVAQSNGISALAKTLNSSTT